MTKEQFQALERGDILRNKSSKSSYVVDANYGNRVSAVKTVDITNPDEWELVQRAKVLYDGRLSANIMFELYRQVGENPDVPLSEAREELRLLGEQIIKFMFDNNIDPYIEDFDEFIENYLFTNKIYRYDTGEA